MLEHSRIMGTNMPHERLAFATRPLRKHGQATLLFVSTARKTPLDGRHLRKAKFGQIQPPGHYYGMQSNVTGLVELDAKCEVLICDGE